MCQTYVVRLKSKILGWLRHWNETECIYLQYDVRFPENFVETFIRTNINRQRLELVGSKVGPCRFFDARSSAMKGKTPASKHPPFVWFEGLRHWCRSWGWLVEHRGKEIPTFLTILMKILFLYDFIYSLKCKLGCVEPPNKSFMTERNKVAYLSAVTWKWHQGLRQIVTWASPYCIRDFVIVVALPDAFCKNHGLFVNSARSKLCRDS